MRNSTFCSPLLLLLLALSLSDGRLAARTDFRRGDADADGSVNVTDAVRILGHLFLGYDEPKCRDAADTEDNGRLTITDALLLLNYLFLGGPAPAVPGPERCGIDPTVDDLDCAEYAPPNPALTCEASAEDGPLFLHPLFDIGSRPRSIALGDMNGDGSADLVTTTIGEINVLLNLGGGEWSDPASFPTADNPRSAGLGDLDRDGDLDVVVVGRSATVFLNRGDGELEPASSVEVGGTAMSLVDLDGDDNLDVAVVVPDSEVPGEVVVLRNGGGGDLTEAGRYEVGHQLIAVRGGDLDGDGDADLVISDSGVICFSGGFICFFGKCQPRVGSLTVFRNRGDGTFSDAEATAADDGFIMGALEVADLDGDGARDVALAHRLAADLRIYPGRGDGTFRPPIRYTAGYTVRSLVATDLNHDRRLDLVARVLSPTDALPAPGQVWVALNDGAGRFSEGVTYAAGYDLTGTAAADVDGDENIDLVVTTREGFVIRGRGDGTFAEPEALEVGNRPTWVGSGDLDGNGHVDIAAIRDTGHVEVLLNRGGADFLEPAVHELDNDVATTAALEDLDRDGDLDLVVTSFSEVRGDVSVLLGTGDGRLSPPVNYTVGDWPFAVAVGDVNGDRALDVVSASRRILDLRGDVFVLDGRGDGTLIVSGHIVLEEPGGVTLMDVDSDGRLEIVIALRGAVRSYGRVGGRWIQEDSYSFNASFLSAHPFDLDRDGDLDLLVWEGGQLWILWNRGEPRLSAGDPVPFARGELAGVGDLDGDGRPDLVAASLSGSSFSVFPGDDEGTFADPVSYFSGSGLRSLALDDFDGDGDLDVAASHLGTDRISMHLNRTR